MEIIPFFIGFFKQNTISFVNVFSRLIRKLNMNKTITRCIFLLFAILSNSIVLLAQQDVELVKLGDEMYAYGSKKDALEVFLKASSLNDKNARAVFMAGKCYLEINQKTQA